MMTVSLLTHNCKKYDNVLCLLELVFGFDPTEYSVNEGAGGVSLGITFTSGNAGEFVPHVTVSTEDGTAISKRQDMSK